MENYNKSNPKKSAPELFSGTHKYYAKYRPGIPEEVINKETGKFDYLAHHYTKKELCYLTKKGGFSIEYYQRKIFTTRTGNKINGCIMIAKKLDLLTFY